jgi:DNA-binding LytR/AlgR family response regulator
MLRILMVEDNESEARALHDCLEAFAAERGDDFAISWEKSAFDLSEASRTADLIFMDINLPGINGMEAAEILRTYDAETPLVFVTNLAQYAVRGYRVDALDFIVKPVTYESVSACLKRAMRVVRRRSDRPLSISTKNGVRVIDLRDLLYVDVQRHDLFYHIVGEAEPFRIRGSLSEAAGKLDGASFVRVSSSHLVNMAHIKNVAGDEITLSDGSVVYFSRAKRKDALAQIARYLGGTQ